MKMETRFDNNQFWLMANGVPIKIMEMETTHLMNTVRMLIQKPSRTISMIITDIERNQTSCNKAWSPNQNISNVKKESIYNVTSMSEEDLILYVMDTTLYKSMIDELENRGVNVEIFTNKILNECDSF